ncbi:MULTISPECIES: LysM peptidoglycan-binding domain-containing protein [Streptomyces]|uniref:LysM peptidoglycan-binding domain-containing protein n=1 Tax=Streptomyces TaxID=1883 RepID=UPI001965DDCE|nr:MULTISPECIES: transglycosylase family protein [Streptomyces]QRX93118.1 LysM peptidoglycan-binding domain-containing protein [Streptomyces noursei]UJB42827.1 LysM peptidoglycan-binding domain-containing protein [Streptomyces sp. A1-5]
MPSPLAGRAAGSTPSTPLGLLCLLLLVVAAGPAFAGPPPPSGTDWDQIAACESSGDWQANTGNGYHGGLQISPATWRAYGGVRYAARADLATRDEQIAIGERIAQDRGLAPWPNCGRLGSSSSDRALLRVRPVSRALAAPAGAYTVRPGDCLSAIARRARTPGGPSTLYSLNKARLSRGPDQIFPGQNLRLRG